MFHSINGYIFGNLPGLIMKQGERVRWYLLGMGDEKDMHTPHWHGNTVTYRHRHTDVIELLPASMTSADMLADNPGNWMFHCHVSDHMEAGMMASYTIVAPAARSCPVKLGAGEFWDSSAPSNVEATNTSGKSIRRLTLHAGYFQNTVQALAQTADGYLWLGTEVGLVRFDGMGSILAVQGSAGPKVMVDAHMDELGGVVRRVTPNGLLTMQMLGGWLDQALVDQRWIILGAKGPVHAITGIRDVHVVPAEERTHVYSRDSLFLDVGAHTAEEVRQMGLSPGDPVTPDSPFLVLNGANNYLGKAWDDRVGCAVIVEVMRRLSTQPHPNQIVYAITTQEEIGLRGAHSAADAVKPELGLALEAGITGDVFPGNRRC